MQTELTTVSPLLDEHGNLSQVGWSRQPLLDCNLEKAHFYALRPLQRFRIKRWDYYAVFTPRRFFSATFSLAKERRRAASAAAKSMVRGAAIFSVS